MEQARQEETVPELVRRGGRNPYLAGYEQERRRRTKPSGGNNADSIDMIWGTDIQKQVRQQGGKTTLYDKDVRRTAGRDGDAARYARRSSGKAIDKGVRRSSGKAIDEGVRRGSGNAVLDISLAEAVRKKNPGADYSSAQRRRAERKVVNNREIQRSKGQKRRPEVIITREDQRRQARENRRRRMLYVRIAVGLLEAAVVVGLAALFLMRLEKPAKNDGSLAPVLNNAAAESESGIQGVSAEAFEKHPEWTEDFLTPNEYSRPGDPLGEVTNIFVHYTANPGTSAKQNRSYFEQLKDTHERGASAHFIIGYEGEIIQCVPLDEIAYAVQTRNQDSISIECCYKAADGSFTQETYDSLIHLLKWLTDTYGLGADDILRHYDCGGKKCPLYYTEHEDAWERLKEDVKAFIL